MSGLDDVAEVVIPHEIFVDSHLMLREIGLGEVEGMVLWAGVRRGALFDVEEVIRPLQHNLRTESGLCVIVDGAELHRVNTLLYRKRMQLVAQVHTHPTDAYHSDTDDAIPIVTTVGGLSLVVPDFARGPAELSTYAGYRLSEAGEWREVPTLASLIRVAS